MNWFGFTKRARVIIYNKSRVNAGDIARYEDLANPKWKGKLLIRSSSNVYNQWIFAGSNFEYPAVNGVQMNATLTGFGKFKADSMNPKVFGQKNGAALRVMDRSGWT